MQNQVTESPRVMMLIYSINVFFSGKKKFTVTSVKPSVGPKSGGTPNTLNSLCQNTKCLRNC